MEDKYKATLAYIESLQNDGDNDDGFLSEFKLADEVTAYRKYCLLLGGVGLVLNVLLGFLEMNLYFSYHYEYYTSSYNSDIYHIEECSVDGADAHYLPCSQNVLQSTRIE